jgi:hypothetical protein
LRGGASQWRNRLPPEEERPVFVIGGGKGVNLMRRFLLVVTVALVMAAMMVATAGAAMAHSVAAGNPCPEGLDTAHGKVQNETAHHNIPCG